MVAEELEAGNFVSDVEYKTIYKLLLDQRQNLISIIHGGADFRGEKERRLVSCYHSVESFKQQEDVSPPVWQQKDVLHPVTLSCDVAVKL